MVTYKEFYNAWVARPYTCKKFCSILYLDPVQHPLQTPLVLLLNHRVHSSNKVPPPFHKTALCFLPALKIATILRIPSSLPELPAQRKQGLYSVKYHETMGTPGWNVQLVGRSWGQRLAFFHSIFVHYLFWYKYKYIFAYMCYFLSTYSKLTLTSLFKRLLLIVGLFFLFPREPKKVVKSHLPAECLSDCPL